MDTNDEENDGADTHRRPLPRGDPGGSERAGVRRRVGAPRRRKRRRTRNVVAASRPKNPPRRSRVSFASTRSPPRDWNFWWRARTSPRWDWARTRRADGANSKSRRVARQVRHLRGCGDPRHRLDRRRDTHRTRHRTRRHARRARRARADGRGAARRRREPTRRERRQAAAGRAAASAATAAAMAAVDDATRRASADTSAIGVGGLSARIRRDWTLDVESAGRCVGGASRVSRRARRVRARNFAPSEAAARAVLATGASIRLPQWLSARFVARRGGGGAGAPRREPLGRCSPAYLQYGRLEEAGGPRSPSCARARRVDAVARTKSAAAWFPEPMLAHTRDRMMEVAALEKLRMALDDALEEHRRRRRGG